MLKNLSVARTLARILSNSNLDPDSNLYREGVAVILALLEGQKVQP